jgi:hypothetical protein
MAPPTQFRCTTREAAVSRSRGSASQSCASHERTCARTFADTSPGTDGNDGTSNVCTNSNPDLSTILPYTRVDAADATGAAADAAGAAGAAPNDGAVLDHAGANMGTDAKSIRFADCTTNTTADNLSAYAVPDCCANKGTDMAPDYGANPP